MEKSRRDLQEEWERSSKRASLAMRDRVQSRRQQERATRRRKGCRPGGFCQERSRRDRERASGTREGTLRGSHTRAAVAPGKPAARRVATAHDAASWWSGGRRGKFPRPESARSSTGRPAFSSRWSAPRSSASAGSASHSRISATRRTTGRADEPVRLADHKSMRDARLRLLNPNTRSGCETSTTSSSDCSRSSKKLKEEKKSQESKDSSSRRARSGQPRHTGRLLKSIGSDPDPSPFRFARKGLRSTRRYELASASALGFPGFTSWRCFSMSLRSCSITSGCRSATLSRSDGSIVR